MRTVLDELVVEFGLDHRKFDEGSRDVDASFRKTREGAEAFGKDVERQGMKLSEVFGIVRKGALGVVGALAGGEAAAFIDHIVGMDAATGRFAKTIGTSVENLSEWQGMLRAMGGSAESARGTLSALQQEIESVRQGGGMFEGGFATLMNKSGATVRDDADAMLRKIRGYLAGEVESGRMKPEEQATWLRRVPGMNPDMLNVLNQSTKAFEELAAAVRAVGGATKESADNAAYFQKKISLLIQSVEELGRKLLPVFKLLTTPLNQVDTSGGAKGAFDKMDSGTGPLFEPGSKLDRFYRWQYRKIWGEDPPAAPSAAAPSASPAPSEAAGRQSRGDRNNNPGNIEYGPFARAHGATGTDGRFAIFPDKAAGESAMAELLTKGYTGLTMAQIQRKWVGNADQNYLGSMSRATGLSSGEVPNLRDPEMRGRLIAGMARGEGSHVGAAATAANRGARREGAAPASGGDVSIGNITLPGVKDADGFARELPAAIKRQSMLAPANTGLV